MPVIWDDYKTNYQSIDYPLVSYVVTWVIKILNSTKQTNIANLLLKFIDFKNYLLTTFFLPLIFNSNKHYG